MTRQLCVYIKRARENAQKSIHGKTSEKRAYSLNTQKKYIPACAKKRKYTVPPHAFKVGQSGYKFCSKFLGSLQYFLPWEFNLIVIKTQFCYHDNAFDNYVILQKIASHDHCQKTVLLNNLGAAPTTECFPKRQKCREWFFSLL